eukprot:gene16646-biopygen4626
MSAAAVRCQRCCYCEALVSWANAAERSAEERRLRRLFVPVWAWLAATIFTAAALMGALRVRPRWSGDAGMLGGAAALICATAAARRPPARVAEGVMVVGFLCAVLVDARTAAVLNPRFWSFAVLLIDAGLVAGARVAVQRGVVAVVVAWLSVERMEAASRFGLYRATCFGDDAYSAFGIKRF